MVRRILLHPPQQLRQVTSDLATVPAAVLTADLVQANLDLTTADPGPRVVNPQMAQRLTAIPQLLHAAVPAQVPSTLQSPGCRHSCRVTYLYSL